MNLISTDQLLATELQHISDRVSRSNQGFSSGYPAFDTDLMGGFQEGSLYCLGSVASMGKTMVALNFIVKQLQNLAFNEVIVFVVSTETSQSVLIQKLLAIATGIELRKIQSSALTESELETLKNHSFLTLLKSNNLIIIEENKPGMIDIEEAMNISVKEGKIPKMLYIDCLHDMQVNIENKNSEQAIFSLMHKLKVMAAQFKVPVLFTSKVSKRVFYRKQGQVPKLDDLLFSRFIAEIADYVFMLHRPNYYQIPDESVLNNTVEELHLYFRKNQNLPLNVLVMGADLKTHQILEEPNYNKMEAIGVNLP
jgi:replicative DNA helicase